jgi:tetratricopeptide (TPR) repeat protein
LKKAKPKVHSNKVRSDAGKKIIPAGQKTTGLYIGLTLILLFTLYSFFPAIHNGFTNWDDPALLTDNPLIKKISAENIKRIFTEPYFANYQPLHMLSYMLEYKFFGLDSKGYHWVSIILHLINILLVAYLVKLISKNNNFITLFTALFFAITPMRVESIAWAAERKDLLYSMSFFAAMIFYTYYLQRKYNLKYILLTFLFFTLSVFSKTMAVSLVPVLFLMDFYFSRKFTWRLILEKIPFLILAVVMGIISVISSKAAGSMETGGMGYGFSDRIFFATHNLINYAAKLVYPYGLTAYYQYPDSVGLEYYISAVIVLIAAVFIFFSIKKNKLLFFSAGYFVATIALVLMLIPVGPTVFSERYSYVPSVMLYFLLLFYLYKWIEKKNSVTTKNIVAALLISYAIFFAQVTRARCAMWKDSITLWTDVIKNNPRVPQAFNNRGHAYSAAHDLQKALADFRQTISLQSNFEKPYASISNIFREEGMYDSAFYYANKALELKADMPQALVNRGIVYAVSNNTQAAMEDFNKAIQLQPEMFEAYNNRGNLYCILGKPDSGLVDYNHSIQLNPDFTEPYINKGRLLKDRNQFDEAIESFNIYLNKGGTDPNAYLMQAVCYAGKKDFTKALQLAQQAKSLGVNEAEKYIADLQKSQK